MVDDKNEKHQLLKDVNDHIIDVAPFDSGLLVLLSYGNMLYISEENGQLIEYQLPVVDDIVPTLLVPFDDTVVTLADNGRLYEFEFFNDEQYSWIPILENITNATYIHSPHDGSLLWVQTPEKGMAYDTELNLVDSKPLGFDFVRIYGPTSTTYMDVNRNQLSGRSSTSSTPYTDVYTGTWTNQQFVKVSYNQVQDGVKQVRTIGGHLYYVIMT
jgi:hypothetical protein